jgi:hypothetical protein
MKLQTFRKFVSVRIINCAGKLFGPIFISSWKTKMYDLRLMIRLEWPVSKRGCVLAVRLS